MHADDTGRIAAMASSSPVMEAGHQILQIRSQRAEVTAQRTGDELVLPDGTRLLVRPLTRDDRDGVLGLFHRLSEESRWRRFLSPMPDLSPRALDHLSNVDHVAHEAFTAVDGRDGSLAGIARYIRHNGTEAAAELAVEVADELQHQGIGTALSLRVVERARANGFSVLTATTLWNDQPARALLRRLGFHARRSQGREIELELPLDKADDCA